MIAKFLRNLFFSKTHNLKIDLLEFYSDVRFYGTCTDDMINAVLHAVRLAGIKYRGWTLVLDATCDIANSACFHIDKKVFIGLNRATLDDIRFVTLHENRHAFQHINGDITYEGWKLFWKGKQVFAYGWGNNHSHVRFPLEHDANTHSLSLMSQDAVYGEVIQNIVDLTNEYTEEMQKRKPLAPLLSATDYNIEFKYLKKRDGVPSGELKTVKGGKTIKYDPTFVWQYKTFNPSN